MMTLIQNGTIITSSGSFPGDILIEGEKIKAVGCVGRSQEGASCAARDTKASVPVEAGMSARGGSAGNMKDVPENAQRVDAAGKLIFPGFIDAHTHFDLHVAGTVTCDDFASGTKAAISGGTTTIIDFGTQYPGETLSDGLRNWKKKAEAGVSCDYGIHMSITEWNDAVSDECQLMMDEGVTTFKLYLTYDTKVDDRTLYKVLKRLKEVGGITGVHCENDGLIAALQEEYAHRGGDVSCHYRTRPPAAEAEAIGRLLHICEVVGTPVIDVHLTCEEGLKEIRAARQRGQTVYAETCPQYLTLTRELYDLPGFEGARYVISPPLREKSDTEALWRALADGEIQTVATDHCAFTLAQKELGKKDFRKIPGGMPGVETRGLVIYSEGVARGHISVEKMCKVLCENPAKLYGLYPRKGVIQEGSDADLVILDPNQTKVITASQQVSRCDYAPLEGRTLTGAIESVYLRGQLVVADGAVIRENQGVFLKRGHFMSL